MSRVSSTYYYGEEAANKTGITDVPDAYGWRSVVAGVTASKPTGANPSHSLSPLPSSRHGLHFNQRTRGYKDDPGRFME